MTNLVEVAGLCKRYDSFTLDHIDLTVPEGQIVGLIGENGAGKTTTIKSILGVVRPDGGTIRLMGKPSGDKGALEKVGVVFEDSYFNGVLTPSQIDRILQGIRPDWDSVKFRRDCEAFGLDHRKKIKDFSRGMRMKLSLASALSHDCRLLILDEATSGLDPVVRDEMLDLFLEFIQDEGHSIFVSSHILSDLEKVCDYITLIHGGRIVFSEEKDALLEKYVVAKVSEAELRSLDPAKVAGVRRSAFGAEALVERSAARGLVCDPAGIEDIMLYYLRGERK